MKVKITIEKHSDGRVAYPLDLKDSVIGAGDTDEQVLSKVQTGSSF